MWYIYTMEYYIAIKKNEIMSFVATKITIKQIENIDKKYRGFPQFSTNFNVDKNVEKL